MAYLGQQPSSIALTSADIADNAVTAAKLNSTDVTSFAKTLLNDADAGTSRTTIGAVGLTGNESVAGIKTFSGIFNPSAGITGLLGSFTPPAGTIGEIISASSGSVAISDSVITNTVSISLTSGFWLVVGNTQFSTSAGATSAVRLSSLSTVSATMQTFQSRMQYSLAGNSTESCDVPTRTFQLSSTTTMYIVAQSVFSGGTMTANSNIQAIRIA